MTDLVIGTHNDLDALGTMLNIEYRFPNVSKQYFHTNYYNMEPLVQGIIDSVTTNNVKHVLLTDISFSDEKQSLQKLYELTEKGVSLTFIDHHIYPEGFFDDFPNMKIIHDTSKSATLLCNEYFSNTGKDKRLDQLTYLIDVYDLWQINDKAFNVSQDLNNYFWNCGKSILELNEEITNKGFKLPSDFKDVVQKVNDDCDQAIEQFENSKLIQRSGLITLCFVDEWFNQIMLQEMASGKDFVVGINSYGVIRVRIKQETPYTAEQISKLKEVLVGKPDYGHMHAFTYKMNGKGFEKLIKEAERVVNVIKGSCIE